LRLRPFIWSIEIANTLVGQRQSRINPLHWRTVSETRRFEPQKLPAKRFAAGWFVSSECVG
jgi:hypothetical protein